MPMGSTPKPTKKPKAAIEFSEDFFKSHWYHSFWFIHFIAFVCTIFFIWPQLVNYDWFDVNRSLAGLVLYLVGARLDFWSTWEGMKYKQEFDAYGLDLPFFEKNIFMPDYPTREQFVRNETSLKRMLLIAILFFVPGLLFGLGIMRCLVTFNNLYWGRKARLILEKINTEITSRGMPKEKVWVRWD